MRFTPGTRLNQYELRSLIATGGGGEVYLACDTQLGRTVALKVLPATTGSAIPDSRVALLEEARAASALNHPNILTIYEIGRADSIVFMATEFVEGETLQARLSCRPLALRDALNISSQIASALSAAHSKGLIHCDLKPENIMLRADGMVKILDFGLARRALRQDVPAQEHRLTISTAPPISGTTGYLAPEQLRGHQPDARTDLWAFGVVIFEMLTGKRPFARTTVEEELRAIQDEEPPPLSTLRAQVPLALESIARRALTKESTARYQSAVEISSDLKLLEQQLSIDSSRPALIKVPSEKSANESLIPETGILAQYHWPHALAHWSFFSQSSRRRLLWIGMALIVLALIMLPFTGMRAGFLYGVISILVLGVSCLAVRFASVNVKRNTRTAPTASVAFRGLVPFQEADRDSFYGRDIETGTLFAMVTRESFRFGALFGESGCGKTSLLLAGLIPKLWDEGYVPLYCRSFTDPLAAVLDECRKRSCLQQKADETTSAYLRRVVRQFDAPLIIICDQFEEFFVNFRNASEREPFIRFVTDCHNEPDLPVRLLLSLRSDFLYLINAAFTARISEPLLSSKLYHLRNFDEDVAEEILERSARSAALPFEPGLSGQIARDLAVNHLVAPSEVQIVGAQLQARRVFTFDSYRRAGSKEALVHDFLEDLIQASGEADNARLLLRSLISEENTRLTLSIGEICKRTQRNGEIVSRLLQQFANARLVRELQEQEPWRYELMHEYLIDKINRVTGQVLDSTQRANRHFRQYLTNYSLDPRTRIPLTRLWFIRRYSDVERGERERELLKKSLRRGLVKSSAVALLLALAAMVVAAAFSVREEWTTTRLSDGHTAAARRIAFSPDGRLLVSVGEDAKVIVWDFARRERIATLADHTGWVNSVAFSPDGKWFATASDDQTVIVWDAARVEKAAVLTGHERPVKSVAFLPDGKLLASASDARDYATILWDVDRWKEIGRVPVFNGPWGHLYFTSDGRYLLSSGFGLSERTSGPAWDLATEKQAADFSELQCGGNDIAISPDGHLIAGVDGQGYVMFADLTARRFLKKIRAHRFHGRAMAFSPDGRLLASGAEDIVLWDPSTQTRLQRLEHSADVWSLAFSPDGRWLVSSHSDGAILLWDVEEREAVANLNEHYRSVRSIAFSADGKRLASASEDRSIIIWDAERNRKEAVLAGHSTRATAAAFSPDGQSVASCDQDAEIRLWDVAQRRPRWTFKYPNEGAGSYCLAFSPDGRYVTTTNCVNDSADGRMILDLIPFRARYNTSAIYGASFSTDGRRLACVSEDGWVLLLDTASWQLIDRLQLPGVHLISASFSPDGKGLVTGDDEGDVRLWEVSPLRPVAVIGRHAARIKSVAFSPDGSEVASAGDDQTIALWNVARRSLITHIGTHTAPVLSVAFAPDGKRIAAGGQDKSARIYTRHRTLWGYNLD